MNIGAKLKEARKERKITQVEISHLLNIDQGTYSGYERNKHLPDIVTLVKIADILKVSLDYLCGRYEKAS